MTQPTMWIALVIIRVAVVGLVVWFMIRTPDELNPRARAADRLTGRAGRKRPLPEGTTLYNVTVDDALGVPERNPPLKDIRTEDLQKELEVRAWERGVKEYARWREEGSKRSARAKGRVRRNLKRTRPRK